MRFHPLNLYAHFLDRELRESVDAKLTSDDLVSYLLLAFLVSPGSVYCSYSHLWESPIYQPTIARLLESRALIPVSDHVSGAEFLESRRELYIHDRARYPHYFEPRMATIITATNPVMIAKGERTTTILAANLGEWSRVSTNDGDVECRAKDIVISALSTRKSEAITHALFRNEAPNDEAALRIIRREISLNYLRRYQRTCMADIATGQQGLEFYDSAAVKYPVYDLQLLHTFLTAIWSRDWHDLHNSRLLRSLLNSRIGPDAFAFREHWESAAITICAGIDARVGAPSASRTLILNSLGGLLGGLPSRAEINFGILAAAASELNYAASHRFGPIATPSGSDNHRVLLIVATDLEQERLLDRICHLTNVEPHPGYAVPFWTATVKNSEVYVTRCSMGPLGVIGSINAARTAIESVRPRYCIMPGICMGLREDKCKIGDLLIADQLTDCETGKVTETDTQYRGKSLPGDSALLSAARMATSAAKIHFGEMLSGVKVINNKELTERLRATYPNAIGLEMEGYGVASACLAVGKPFILAKSICDWGYNKSDENQRLAADFAMKFALDLIVLMDSS